MQIHPKVMRWTQTLAVSAAGLMALYVIFRVAGRPAERSVLSGVLQGFGGYAVTTALAAWGRKKPKK